ncbi:MAG: EF-P beta-lysylation protein EpmB [Planctomycetales bacterium]|nr:EF-P beta-lysylation protein EpmB [Planctomycetales bacterium]
MDRHQFGLSGPCESRWCCTLPRVYLVSVFFRQNKPNYEVAHRTKLPHVDKGDWRDRRRDEESRDFVIETQQACSLGTESKSSWQEEMRAAFRTVERLCEHLGLNPSEHASIAAARDFPLFAPWPYVRRIRPGDPADPLLLQILPVPDETKSVPGFSDDPLAETAATMRPGLLQKYDRRVLLVTTGACAIHCRYCFRRSFPYADVPNSISDWQDSIDAIAEDPSIDEVILSGGDPLMLVDSTLTQLIDAISQIEHVSRLRIHTRLPIVIPSRVTDSLVGMLGDARPQTIVVLHANHPDELDTEVEQAIDRLSSARINLLNQSVLLRGVNDSVQCMESLCRKLVNLGILPYYMHQLDRVNGAAHFEVGKDEGRKIVESLRERLPGYAVPTYVEELPGHASKKPIA